MFNLSSKEITCRIKRIFFKMKCTEISSFSRNRMQKSKEKLVQGEHYARDITNSPLLSLSLVHTFALKLCQTFNSQQANKWTNFFTVLSKHLTFN